MISKAYVIHHIFIVDEVFINLSKKISDNDLIEFEKEFGFDLTIQGISFNEFGEKSEFEYSGFPSILSKFKSYVNEWLKSHEYPFDYTILSNNISLKCYENLSAKQIQEFEKEFEDKLVKYEISCSGNDINYIFN